MIVKENLGKSSPSMWHAPTLKDPEHTDFSRGQNGRSSSQTNSFTRWFAPTDLPIIQPSDISRRSPSLLSDPAICAERFQSQIHPPSGKRKAIQLNHCSHAMSAASQTLTMSRSTETIDRSTDCHRYYPVNLSHSQWNHRSLHWLSSILSGKFEPPRLYINPCVWCFVVVNDCNTLFWLLLLGFM